MYKLYIRIHTYRYIPVLSYINAYVSIRPSRTANERLAFQDDAVGLISPDLVSQHLLKKPIS